MSSGRNGVITDTHILDDQGGSVMNIRTDGKAPTIRAQMGGHPPVVMLPESAEGLDAYNQTLTGDKAKTLNSAASDADHIPCAVYSVENHPADSRVNLDESGKVQTLTSRMGTGGGNVPMVMEPFCKSRRAKSPDDATTWKHAEVANTLNTFDQGEARANEIIVMATQQGGAEICENLCPTITAAAGMSGNNQPVIARPIHSMTTGDYMQVNEEKTATLLARDYKDPTCVEVFDEKERRYIVRRLTPTECARLQGFPDKWGHLEPKTKLTDEEYQFWLNVRKTHDAINERAEKDYVKKQILTWYNKLWTDSAEYKMWGNGIALPCALYVMQGIKDALDAEKIARSKWLDELLGGL